MSGRHTAAATGRQPLTAYQRQWDQAQNQAAGFANGTDLDNAPVEVRPSAADVSRVVPGAAGGTLEDPVVVVEREVNL